MSGAFIPTGAGKCSSDFCAREIRRGRRILQAGRLFHPGGENTARISRHGFFDGSENGDDDSGWQECRMPQAGLSSRLEPGSIPAISVRAKSGGDAGFYRRDACSTPAGKTPREFHGAGF
jgi:hypothetical protein